MDPLSTATLVVGVLVFFALYLSRDTSRSKTTIHELGGLSILTAWTFFSKRYDFLWDNFQKTGEKLFQFCVLNHRVVAISGEEARKMFFNNKEMNVPEGYKILMGGVPSIDDIDVDQAQKLDASGFNKRLLALLNKKRLGDLLPTLFDDIHKRTLAWGAEGKIDPFRDIYDIVFQMTVRMATCGELASDPVAVSRLGYLFWAIEKSVTPVSQLLTWFPSPARKRRERATREMYEMLAGYVNGRRATKVPSPDAIDVLIADGDDNSTIISFIMVLAFAGVVNTGILSCWVLLYLASEPEWKKKVALEVFALIEAHTDTSSSDPLCKRLSAIPVSAWEDEMPAVEIVIRETLRLVMTGTLLRRNVVKDVPVAGKIIERGVFVAYNSADVHLNPSIYPDPLRFDPERFLEDRQEDKKAPLSYVAWGAGRHPCSGMKVAKLEMKMILALFLAGYEYELVDESGKFPNPFPQPDRNDIHHALPLGKPCYLKYKRVVE